MCDERTSFSNQASLRLKFVACFVDPGQANQCWSASCQTTQLSLSFHCCCINQAGERIVGPQTQSFPLPSQRSPRAWIIGRRGCRARWRQRRQHLLLGDRPGATTRGEPECIVQGFETSDPGNPRDGGWISRPCDAVAWSGRLSLQVSCVSPAWRRRVQHLDSVMARRPLFAAANVLARGAEPENSAEVIDQSLSVRKWTQRLER